MAGQTLSITQMYALARSAGLNPARAVVAAAIGMAESSGRTAVTSDNPDGGVNVGVWQLDTKGVGTGYTVAQLQNPATNAKVMAKGSADGTNWSDWATYASGAYQKYTSQAQAAASSESGGGSGWLDDVLKAIGVAGGNAGGLPALGKAASGIVGQLLTLPSQVTDFLASAEKIVQGLMWFVGPAADPGLNMARVIAGFFGFLLLGAGLITLGLAAA